MRLNPIAALLVIALAAPAADFVVDPVAGSPAGDGSAANPWRTLQEVIAANLVLTRDAGGVVVHPGAPIGPGSTIRLRSGYHGDVSIQTAFNDAVITVVAEAGHTPRLGRLQLRSVGRWTFRGLSISPSHRAAYQRLDIVSIDGNSRDVAVDACDVFSLADSSAWTADQWINTASSGIGNGGLRSGSPAPPCATCASASATTATTC